MTFIPPLPPIESYSVADPIVSVYTENGIQMYVDLSKVDAITGIYGTAKSHRSEEGRVLYFCEIGEQHPFLHFDMMIRGQLHSFRAGDTDRSNVRILIVAGIKRRDLTSYYEQYLKLVEFWRQIKAS